MTSAPITILTQPPLSASRTLLATSLVLPKVTTHGRCPPSVHTYSTC